MDSLSLEQQALLTPLAAAKATAEDRTAALAERLSQCRSLAEKAVHLAAETFTQRLAAVNAVSICKAENICCLEGKCVAFI